MMARRMFSCSLFMLIWTVVMGQIQKDVQRMSTRPLASNEIFRVEAASEAKCIYLCVVNQYCRALVYPDPGQACAGYFSNASDGTRLAAETQAWSATEYVCPAGMTMDPATKICYQVFSAGMTQRAAMAYCKQIHPSLHLVDLQTRDEQIFVNDYVASQCPECGSYYTSGMNTAPSKEDPGVFKWIYTGQVMTYRNWRKTQPYRAKKADVCVIALKGYGWQWDDVACNRMRPFVSEL